MMNVMEMISSKHELVVDGCGCQLAVLTEMEVGEGTECENFTLVQSRNHKNHELPYIGG
jgi:hypothetical protein